MFFALSSNLFNSNFTITISFWIYMHGNCCQSFTFSSLKHYLIVSILLVNDKRLSFFAHHHINWTSCISEPCFPTLLSWVQGSDTHDSADTALYKTRMVCILSFLFDPVWKLFRKAGFNDHNFVFYLFSATLVCMFQLLCFTFFSLDLFRILFSVCLFCWWVFNDITVSHY